jgi:hypothetical protein
MFPARSLHASGSPYLARIQAGSNAPLVDVSPLRAFQRDYAFALIPNWDGKGAVALTGAVIRLANEFLHDYASTKNLVEVTPGRDGSISLVWEDDQDNYVYLDVGPNDTVHLFYNVIGEPKWEGVSIASDTRILSEMARAFRFLHPIEQQPRPEVIKIYSSSKNERFQVCAA